MGFRFRRSLSIAPGLRLNLSRRGSSLSVGGRGATVNLSRRAARTTIGAPGTGVSWSTTSARGARRSPGVSALGAALVLILLAALIAWAL